MFNAAWDLLRDHPGVVLLVALAGLGLVARAVAFGDEVRTAQTCRWLLLGYVVVLLVVVLRPMPHGPDFVHSMNLVPGNSLRDPDSRRFQLLQALGNILLLAPVGVLGAVGFGLRAHGVLAAALALSVGCEVAQYVLRIGRASDVDDVLANTAGAFAAYVLLRLVVGALARARPDARTSGAASG